VAATYLSLGRSLPSARTIAVQLDPSARSVADRALVKRDDDKHVANVVDIAALPALNRNLAHWENPVI
jgi:hypothetical protein